MPSTAASNWRCSTPITLDDHLSTIARYTTTAAQRLFADGRRARIPDLLLRPGWRFLRFYIIEAGWREGWRGLLMAHLAGHYVRLKYIKLWLLWRQVPSR